MNQICEELERHDPEPIALARGYCDGTLSQAELDRLEALLRGDRQAHRQFLYYVDIHARLCWQVGRGIPSPGLAPDPAPLVDESSAHPGRWFSGGSFFGSPALLILLAALLLLVSTTVAWWNLSREKNSDVAHPAPASNPVLATVTKANGRWNGRAEDVRVGEMLPAGTVDLAQGIVELKFQNEAVVLLQSPARLELIEGDRAFLHLGRAVAKVTEQAIGFVIDTPQASLVDLGTEFGVVVDPGRSTQVQVFDGIVDLELREASGRKGHVERLKAGQARLIDQTQPAVARQLNYQPDRFTRTFPAPPANRRVGPQMPFNHSRYETVHVGRVDQAPTIDGDLSEWDHRRAFASRCMDQFSQQYYVEAMLAYDDAGLYVAAHVGDPSPMANQVDVTADSIYYWAGGSVLLRVAASNSFGWPLAAWSSGLGERYAPQPDSVVELDDQIAHVAMWYSKPLAEPQLVMAYGMDSRERVPNPTGWQGAFRKDADGRGYQLEYALPWSLLHASETPRPGDRWPASWTVHWSDDNGRTCTGELVEITNFGHQPYHFLSGPTWGQIIFDPD